MRVLRGGSDQEMTATSEVMDRARTFSGGWLGTAGGGERREGPGQEVQPDIRVPARRTWEELPTMSKEGLGCVAGK